MSSTAIIWRACNNYHIRQRVSDGYASVTDMCKVKGVSFNTYLNDANNSQHINRLAQCMRVPRSYLIDIRGPDNIWIHPCLFVDMSIWIGHADLVGSSHEWREEYNHIPDRIKTRLTRRAKRQRTGPRVFSMLPQELLEYIITIVLNTRITAIHRLTLDKHIYQSAKRTWIKIIRAGLVFAPDSMRLGQICNAISFGENRSLNTTYTIYFVTPPYPYEAQLRTSIYSIQVSHYLLHITLSHEDMRVYVCGYTVYFIRVDDRYVPINYYHGNPDRHLSHIWRADASNEMSTEILYNIRCMLTAILPELLDSFDLKP